MSLLCKIRKQRKAKKLTPVSSADEVAAVGSVDSGEGDGDSDNSVIAGHEDMRNEHFPIQETLLADATREGNASQNLSCIPSYAKQIAHDFVVFGRESRIFTPIVTAAILLLVSSVAFYIGKMATLGITLSILLACKLFASNCNERSKVFSQKETLPVMLTNKMDCTRHAIMFQSCAEVEAPLHGSLMVSENTAGREADVSVNHHREVGNVDTLMAKRKELRRLNCIKLSRSVPPFDEVNEKSPPSRASPRTWFRNLGKPTVTGNDKSDLFPEIGKSVESDSKAFIRRLRKVGPRSAPSSPSRSSVGDARMFSMASDASDTQRSIHGPPPVVRRKSNFRPAASVGREVSETDPSRISSHQGLECFTLGKTAHLANGTLPDSTSVGVVRKAKHFTAALDKAKLKHRNRNAALLDEISPIITPRECGALAGLAAVMINTEETPRKRREAILKPPPALFGANVKTAAQSSSTSGNLLRRQGRLQKSTFGTAWRTVDLVIITSGLLIGRIVAVVVLICYWYASSSLRRNLQV